MHNGAGRRTGCDLVILHSYVHLPCSYINKNCSMTIRVTLYTITLIMDASVIWQTLNLPWTARQQLEVLGWIVGEEIYAQGRAR